MQNKSSATKIDQSGYQSGPRGANFRLSVNYRQHSTAGNAAARNTFRPTRLDFREFLNWKNTKCGRIVSQWRNLKFLYLVRADWMNTLAANLNWFEFEWTWWSPFSGGHKSHNCSPFRTVFISIESSWRGLHFNFWGQVDTSSRSPANSRRSRVSRRLPSSPALLRREFTAEHSLKSTWTQKTFYRAFQELPNGMFTRWIGQRTTEIKINLLTSSTLFRSPFVIYFETI